MENIGKRVHVDVNFCEYVGMQVFIFVSMLICVWVDVCKYVRSYVCWYARKGVCGYWYVSVFVCKLDVCMYECIYHKFLHPLI